MKYNENGMILPKVLLACPTSQRHEHLLDEWLESLNQFNYPIEVFLVDTTPETDEYFKKLQTKIVQEKLINVIRFPWDYSNHIVQHLSYAREKIREFFLAGNYEFLMSLDDDVFLPKWGIERLISYNKDCVGFYYHIYPEDRVPLIMKSGEIIMGKGLEFYSFEEIDIYKDFIERMAENKLTDAEKFLIPHIIKDKYFPQLFNPYAVGLGCLLIKRNVLENVPFRTHDTFIFGEDLWWFNEARDKRFEFWCDCRTRCIHKNTEWNSVLSKGPQGKPDFSIAIGPLHAEGIDIIKRQGDENA
jgi:GT2 family glycosyltransferase